MSQCRRHPVNTVCQPEDVEDKENKITCEPLDVCLGAGRRLTYDGYCFSVRGNVSIEDGWYTEVRYQDGCVVEARQAPLPIYTPPPCAPVPEPCGGSGEGSVTLSPDTCNLSRWDAAGELLTTVNLVAGSGVTISGCGSVNSPAVISAASSDSHTYIVSGSPQQLQITGSGTITDSYILRMTDSPLAPGTYGGFTTDSFGRIVGYATPESSEIVGIVAGPGLDVNVTGGIATVALNNSGVVEGTYSFGGYDVQVDATGRMLDIARTIATPAGNYILGDYSITLTDTGSIAAINPVTTLPTASFSRVYLGNRDTMVMQFTTTMPGKFRITYKGNLGITLPVAPGIQRYAGSDIVVRINNDAQILYCEGQTGGTGVGYVATTTLILSGAAYQAGTQLLEIELTTAIEDPGIIDIEVVSEGD